MRLGGMNKDVLATLALFALFFLTEGLLLPFFPLWLNDRGLDAAEVSFVLGAPLFVRIFAAPLFGRMSDRYGQRAMICGASALVLGATVLLPLSSGFWAVMALTLLLLVSWQSMPMQLDAVVIGLVRRGLVRSYGPVRALGSGFFVVSASLAGFLIGAPVSDALLIGVGAFVVGLIACSAFLPAHEAAHGGGGAALPRSVWRQPSLILVMLAAALVQSPHVAFMAIGGIHMRALGYSDALIGVVMSAGTVAEVAMFIIGPRLAGPLAPIAMIAIGATASVVRWAVLATVETPAAMIALQMSHALTFSMTALGMIGYLVRSVDPRQVAATQGLFVALNSALMAILTFLAGNVYTRFGASAFLMLSILPAVGLGVLAVRALRYRSG